MRLGKRPVGLLLVLFAVSCGKVKDPTPKGAVLIDWDRSTAKGYAPSGDPPKHPLVDAKIVEGPTSHAYTVTLDGVEGKTFSFDVDVEAAKVTFADDKKGETRWATTKVTAKVRDNDAFHLSGSCNDSIGYVLAAPGEVTNTVIDCQVVAKRPNSMGTKDAITEVAFLQIEGNGKVMQNNDKAVHIADR